MGLNAAEGRGLVSEGQPSGGDSPRYLIEVGLVGGGTLEGEPGSDPVRSLGELDKRLATDTFVAIDERLVVRSSDVRFVRLREADGSSSGLLDTIKDKIGGSQMSTYGNEPGSVGSMGGAYEEPTRTHQAGVQRQQRGWMDDIGYGRRPWSETKPFFLTSEFLAFVFAVLGVGIAMATSDLLDAHRGWTLIAAIAIGYMVSRGLAKSGARDPNPEPRYRD
jgi:hypothetical protein